MFEITDVEYGDDELDVGIVSDAIDRVLTTGFAECAFICRSLISLLEMQ